MDSATGLAIIALARQLMNLLRYLTNRDWNGALTIGAAWLVGVLSVFLVTRTTLGSGDIFGINLVEQGLFGQIVLGMVIGSATGLVSEVLGVFRKKDDASRKAMFPGLAKKDPPPPEPETVQVPAQEIEITPPAKENRDSE